MTAEQLIQHARETQATILDLGNCGLTELPQELASLTHLEVLILSSGHWEWNNDKKDYELIKSENSQEGNILNDISILSSLTNLHTLHCGDARSKKWNISDISALKYLTKLKRLYLNRNEITDISPLSNLVSLEYLYIVDNKINNINSLLELTELKELWLANNQINDVSALSNLVKLRNLIFYSNQVSDISPLTNLNNLQNLHFWENQVNDLSPLTNLNNLKHLDFSSNQVNDLSPLTNLNNLKHLDFSSNQVNDLSPLTNLNNLKHLDFSSNQASDLSPLTNLNTLQNLSFSSNQVSELFPLTNLNNLQDLSFGSNQVSDLSPLKNLNNLQTLNFWGNQSSDLSPLKNLNNLQTLNFWGNQVSDLSPLTNLNNLKHLDFSSNQASDLSPLTNLNTLQNLSFSSNQVSDLSPLTNLNTLQNLSFSSNQVSDLSPLTNLNTLQNLSFSSNQVSDLSPLKNLNDLKTLNFSFNQVSDLSPLTNLNTLKDLDFSSNQVSNLSPLTNLSNLQTLNFWENQVSDLSPLTNLNNLQKLSFSSNQVSDLSPLKNLNNLQDLSFGSNQVSDLSPLKNLIKNKGLAVKWSNKLWKENGIYLLNNPLIKPPLEIVKEGNESILDYWAEVKAYGETYLNEAKVLILGEGGDGKTTLLLKLQKEANEMPKEGQNTLAIDITPLAFRAKDERMLQMNVWDFGGQDIYKATHQFFLSENAVYILLHNTRRGEADYLHNQEFIYWLEVAKLYGGSNAERKECNAKVLIFQNEEGNSHKEINLPSIIAQFPQVHNEKFAVNLAEVGKKKEIPEWKKFKATLEHTVEHLPNLQRPISRRWLKVKEKLEELHKSGKYAISYREYLEDICAPLKMSEENARLCSRFLHELGVCLHFQDKESLNELVILEKTWATKAVYLFFDDKKVKKEQHGKMTKKDRDRVWEDAKYKHYKAALLEIMEKFELCYPLDNQRDAFLIPQLLSSNIPPYEWEKSDNLILRYEYHFLPKGLLSRLIVRLFSLIDSNEKGEKIQWKTGVMLRNSENDTRAEIIEYYPKRYLEIRLTGKNKRELLSTIMWQIEDLHDEYKNATGQTALQVEKTVPCNCGHCDGKHFFKKRTLEVHENKGEKQILCDISEQYANVKTMLHGTFVPKFIMEIQNMIAKAKLSEALERLAKITNNANEVILLQARYAHNEKERSLVSQEDYQRFTNLISKEMLDLVNRLDEEDAWSFSMKMTKHGGDFEREMRGEFIRIREKLADIHADTQAIKVTLAAHQQKLLGELQNLSSDIRYEQGAWEKQLVALDEKQTTEIQRIMKDIDFIKEEEGKNGIKKLLRKLEEDMDKQTNISQEIKTLLVETGKSSFDMDTQLKLKIPLIPSIPALPFFPTLEIEHSFSVDSGQILTNWWRDFKKSIFG